MIKGKILIADDNEDTRFLIKRILEGQDLELMEAKDGKEALSLALADNFDLIILDMLMPRMRGFELIRILRENNVFTPIIGVSNLKDKNAIAYALSVGIDDYIVKPLDREMLLGKIDNYISNLNFIKTFECEIPVDSRYSEAYLDISARIYKIDELGIGVYMNAMPEKGTKFALSAPVLKELDINKQIFIVDKSEYIEDDSNPYRYKVQLSFVSEYNKGKLRKWLISRSS